MGYLLTSVLLWPLLLYQGIRVRRTTVRLPQASGRRHGQAGQGPRLRVLVLGDSAAAGVGVEHQQQALSGQLAEALQPRFSVQWRLVARSGLTTAKMLRYLSKRKAEPFDVVVISLGVNDVTRGVAAGSWLDQQRQLIALLREKYGCRHVVAAAIPPIGQFPALPQPLRWTLGRHASKLDRHARRWMAEQPDCDRVEFGSLDDPSMMAADGFHPGAPIYRLWAQEVARCIERRWTESEDPTGSCP
ncbi:SGNH/GDSL hydrolase family protein [Ferrimonas sediminicola]|uniref:SGNH/GDSL hydrolase family protein n=1 Tax=Ferrimonas sediminicola TaxID=2569538 RepID=A0A4U1BBZ7_9GAMM|nr:SGNH/GDSL hydrolase family protein [Ferrimonas sediminicola]TKB48481.1 SGNH/GDSL hydrolase family protein [Ferrimonas sediminicola]